MPKTDRKTDLRQEIARLEAQLERDPASREFYLLADAYTRSGRFVDAITVCQQGLKHHPQLAEGYVAQGRALFGTGKLNKAIKVLRKAILLPSGGAEPFRLLGEILLRKDAPTEAVTLLEDAVERGVEERSIRALLERARRAVELEKTNVVEVPGPGQRGIGNVAIAGTIGTTGEVELSEQMQRELGRIPAGRGKTPPLDSKGRPRAPISAPDWSSIDDEWAQELDARNAGTFPDLESDVGGPFDRPKLDINLPPLQDPLTEGMPPLPEEDSDAALAAPSSPPAAEAPADGAAGETAARETTATGRDDLLEEPTTTSNVPMELADTMLAMPAVSSSPFEDQPTAKPAVPSAPPAAVPEPEPEDSGREVRFEELLGIPPGAAEPPAAPDEPDLPGPAVEPELLFPEPAPRRSGRRVWMLIVFLLCSAAGGAGVFLWKRHREAEVTRGALENARQAMLHGDRAALDQAGRGLKRALRVSDDPELPAGQQLLTAMLWLHHGVGDAPQVPAISGAPWNQMLARALVRLGNGDAARARSLLEHRPSATLDRALRLLYLAHADWLEGDERQAEEHLSRAMELSPALAWAHVSRGQLALERGETLAGQRACREALQRAPRFQPAAACLARARLDSWEEGGQQQARDQELGRLVAMAPGAPVGKAWQRLLRADLLLRRGELDRGSKAAQDAAASAPDRYALLYYAVEVLLHAGQQDAAADVWDRLKKIRSEKGLALLHASLQLAQGLEQQALDGLTGTLTAAGRRLKARALLAAGKPRKVAAVLDGLTSKRAEVLRAAAQALADRGVSPDVLTELAGRHRRAELYLAQVLLQRGEAAKAAQLARKLVKAPLVHMEAMTVLARAQLAQKQLGQALSTLDDAVRISGSRCLTATGLQGMVYVELGRFPEADTTLTGVLDAGRRTLPLATALTVARALSGRAMEAAAALDQVRKLGASEAQVRELNGFILLARGQAAEAADILQHAEPTLVTLVALGRAELAAGHRRAAERALRKAASIYPSHPLPHLWLGRLYLESGDPRAEAELTEALQLTRKGRHFPRSMVADATVGLVRGRLARGRPTRAMAAQLGAAAKAAPSNAELRRLLGEVMIGLKQYRAARRELLRAADLDPTDADTYFLLGVHARSAPRKARQALKRFLELEPKGRRAKLARRKLARLR